MIEGGEGGREEGENWRDKEQNKSKKILHS